MFGLKKIKQRLKALETENRQTNCNHGIAEYCTCGGFMHYACRQCGKRGVIDPNEGFSKLAAELDLSSIAEFVLDRAEYIKTSQGENSACPDHDGPDFWKAVYTDEDGDEKTRCFTRRSGESFKGAALRVATITGNPLIENAKEAEDENTRKSD